MGRAIAEAGTSRQERPSNTDGRRTEQSPRRSEGGSQRASGSKRKRGLTDDEDDEEYDPRMELSEAEDDNGSCWNCQQRGIVCRKTR